MAYALKYYIEYKNRIQNDIYRVEIYERDYADSTITELTGAETPVNLQWQETDLLAPIKALQFTFSFLSTNTISIEDFYSDDDEKFRVDYYFQSDSAGGGTPQLLFCGYLIQDGASEPLTDQKHVITLNATDNLALLKGVKWNETYAGYAEPLALGGFIRECLEATGIYSHVATIYKSLPLRIYDNLFENTTDDRDDADTNDPLAQTILYPDMFKDSEGAWEDCYSILEKILTSKNACIIQAEGYWNVIRIPEYKIFAGEIPGTEYEFNGVSEDVTAITLDNAALIARNGTLVQPINEDQLKTIQRPFKYVQNTFNYTSPALIRYNDLQLPPGAIPYDTTTDGSLRTDYYDLATYFPDWVQRNGDGSHLRVITDTSTDPESEVERYIHKPADFGNKSGVQFNPIIVSENDSFDFTLQFNTLHDDGFFWVYFRLIAFSGTVYSLNLHFPVGDDNYIGWDTVGTTDWYSEPYGIYAEKSGDANQWFTYTMRQFVDNDDPVLIPEDGVLLIEVDGNSHDLGAPPPSGSGGSGGYQTNWKDIQLTMNQYINDSTQINGQVHTNTGTSTIKAISENTIEMDDSPRSTIAGTLFTDATTTLGYIDTDTGEDTDLGTLYATRTRIWHRDSITEDLRLGEIITEERLLLNYTSRLIVEGSFKNVRYDTTKFISPLTLFTIGFLTGKNFIASKLEIDYMACIFNAKLIEVFSDSDDPVISTDLTAAGDVPFSTTVTDDTEFSLFWDSITGDAWELATSSTIKYIEEEGATINISATIAGTFNIIGLASGVIFQIESTGGTIATQAVTVSPFNITFDGDGSFNTDDILYVSYTNRDGEAGSEVELDITTLSLTGTGGSVIGNIGAYSFKYLYKISD